MILPQQQSIVAQLQQPVKPTTHNKKRAKCCRKMLMFIPACQSVCRQQQQQPLRRNGFVCVYVIKRHDGMRMRQRNTLRASCMCNGFGVLQLPLLMLFACMVALADTFDIRPNHLNVINAFCCSCAACLTRTRIASVAHCAPWLEGNSGSAMRNACKMAMAFDFVLAESFRNERKAHNEKKRRRN